MISTTCKSAIFMSLVTLSTSLNLTAQKTDFSGNWQFRDQESISGTLYVNAMPKQLQVVQKDVNLVIQQTSDDGKGNDYSTTDTLSAAKVFQTQSATSKRKKLIELKWSADKSTFTSTANLFSIADATKKDFTTTDTWSLNEDGTLSFTRKTENFTNGETWEAKAIYEKQ